MRIRALLGPAYDLALAVYDVGKMSRLRFPHRLAPARLISLKPLSGFTSHSQPPLHLFSRLGPPPGSHLTSGYSFEESPALNGCDMISTADIHPVSEGLAVQPGP